MTKARDATASKFTAAEQRILATDDKCLSLLALWHEIKANRVETQDAAYHEERADHLRQCVAAIKRGNRAA